MATPIGGQCHLGIRTESSFASGGVIDNWQTIFSETINPSFANVYSDKVQDTAEQVNANKGTESVAGDIVFPVTPRGPQQWWQCALGQSSSPYYVERPLKSLMIEIDRETDAIHASGCMVESLALSSAQGGELTATATIQAVGVADTSAGDPTYTANQDPYMHNDATFTINGTADTSITTWSLTILNSLVGDLYGTTKRRLDIPAGKLVVTGTFTKLFDDTTERNAFLAESTRSLNVKYARGTNYITFNFPKIRYNTRAGNIGGQSEYILETLEFQAFTDNPGTIYSLQISGDFAA